jgi:hypothetical protein
MTYDTSCSYCGVESYHDEMKTATKCIRCFVEDCFHKDTDKEIASYKIQKSVEVLETCLKCECFRTIRLFYTGAVTHEDWDHEEVHVD